MTTHMTQNTKQPYNAPPPKDGYCRHSVWDVVQYAWRQCGGRVINGSKYCSKHKVTK